MIYNLSAEYLFPTVNYGPYYPSEADGWERLLRGMTFWINSRQLYRLESNILMEVLKQKGSILFC